MVKRIVSGGQTGVDRAALDVALALGIPCGGWCPKGRRAEDGRLPARYPLKETPSPEYPERTEWNVRDSDGTLILNRGRLSGGTAQTAAIVARWGRPGLLVDVDRSLEPARVRAWIAAHRVAVLNVAGPRESKRPGIYAASVRWLRRVLSPSAGAPTVISAAPTPRRRYNKRLLKGTRA